MESNSIVNEYSDPPISQRYVAFTKVMIIVSSIFYPLMLFLVLFKSKTLGDYKYYLLPTITFAYLFQLLIGICQPVFIFPVLGGYAKGLIQNTTNTVSFIIFILILLAAGYGMLGMFYAMLFRYKIIAPENISKWLEIKWLYRGMIAYGYIGMGVGICFGLFFLRPNKDVRIPNAQS